MKTTDIISINGHQAVVLPEGFQLVEGPVSIRKQGDAVILEPVRSACWPKDFFAAVHIEDPAFTRPVQGDTPPVVSMRSH